MEKKLLAEVLEWFDNHGSIQGVPFSEESMAIRIREYQEQHAAQMDTKQSEFSSWFSTECPSGTVIGDPMWWGPKLFNKALGLDQQVTTYGELTSATPVPDHVLATEVIPAMTNPVGRGWEQPSRSRIRIAGGKAHVDTLTFNKFKQYNASYPSAVYPGKMWVRNNNIAYLCWYGEAVDGKCTMHHMELIVSS